MLVVTSSILTVLNGWITIKFGGYKDLGYYIYFRFIFLWKYVYLFYDIMYGYYFNYVKCIFQLILIFNLTNK